MKQHWPQVGAALLGLMLVAGCSRPMPMIAPAKEYGYIVVGASAAAEYGLAAGDTLGEIERQNVAKQVIAAAEREASRIAYSPKCTRYFRARTAYLALLKASCKQREIVDDGEALAAFAGDGQAVGRAMLSLTQDAYTALSPGERPMP